FDAASHRSVMAARRGWTRPCGERAGRIRSRLSRKGFAQRRHQKARLFGARRLRDDANDRLGAGRAKMRPAAFLRPGEAQPVLPVDLWSGQTARQDFVRIVERSGGARDLLLDDLVRPDLARDLVQRPLLLGEELEDER